MREDGRSGLCPQPSRGAQGKKVKGPCARVRTALCAPAASSSALPYRLVQELETSGSCWPGRPACDPWISVLSGKVTHGWKFPRSLLVLTRVPEREVVGSAKLCGSFSFLTASPSVPSFLCPPPHPPFVRPPLPVPSAPLGLPADCWFCQWCSISLAPRTFFFLTSCLSLCHSLSFLQKGSPNLPPRACGEGRLGGRSELV